MTAPELRFGPADNRRAQDIELYAVLLTFIKQRLVYADEKLAKPRKLRIEIDESALHVRTALEHLVLSTLVANRPGAAQVAEAFSKKNGSEARTLVKRINPKYWPVPFDPQSGEDGISRMAEPEESYLREEDWGREYGFCSTLLHAPNPYTYLASEEDRLGDQGKIARLQECSKKIQRLIRRHQIYLSEIDGSFICEVPEDHNVRPSVNVYFRQGKDENS